MRAEVYLLIIEKPGGVALKQIQPVKAINVYIVDNGWQYGRATEKLKPDVWFVCTSYKRSLKQTTI